MSPAASPPPTSPIAAPTDDPPELEAPRVSLVALVLANLWPLVGVLFFGWTVFSVLLLFWAENVVVGVFNLCKMFMAELDSGWAQLAKLFTLPFFAFHYGMFTLVHGVFVIVMFGGSRLSGPSDPREIFHAFSMAGIVPAVLAIALSHGVSFFTNYIGRGMFRTTSLSTLMAQPYGRVVVLHLVILFGGFVVQSAGSPVPALALLVLLKIGIDVAAHLREHTGRGGLLLQVTYTSTRRGPRPRSTGSIPRP